jgi:hypothetical protein
MATPLNVVPLDDALKISSQLTKEFPNAPNESALMEMMILACPPVVDAGISYLDYKSLQIFMINYVEAVKKNDVSFLNREKGYRVQPVDMEEFLESPEFMDAKASVRPVIKYELCRLFEKDNQYLEAVLGGAIGFGKSYFSRMAIKYMVYKLSCLHNPQAEYDLAPGSSIIFILQSVSMTVAKRVLFDQMLAEMKETKFFMETFKFNQRIKSQLVFPSNIYITPVSSSEMAVLGINVYGGVMTEVAYMQVIENSRLADRGSIDGVYDQAERNYTTLVQRMRSRFNDKGKLPGLIILDSATKYAGDFIDRKMEEAKTDPQIFSVRYNQWEVIPKEKFSGESFLVEIGNAERPSRIITHRDLAVPEAEVIDVPIEYLRDFRRNCELALRDFAGRTIVAEHAFLSDRSKVLQATTLHEEMFNGHSLFVSGSIVLEEFFGSLDSPDFAKLINLEYLQEPGFRKDDIFAMHLDLGKVKDNVGLVVGRILDYVTMPSTTCYSDKVGSFVQLDDIKAPLLCLDGILQIRPPYGGEILMDTVRGLAFYLSNILNVKFMTLDRWESTTFIQGARKLKMRSGVVSTNTTLVPYAEWKTAYVEGRIVHPKNEAYQSEISTLQFDPKNDKVDHAPGHHNDICDAAACVVHILTHKVANYSRYQQMTTAKENAERQAKIRTLTVQGSNRRGNMRNRIHLGRN